MTISFKNITPEFKKNFNPRVGLIALSNDLTIESDFNAVCRDLPLDIFINRIQNENPLTKENLQKMQGELESVAKKILPEEKINVIAYGCTSGTISIGEDLAMTLNLFVGEQITLMSTSSIQTIFGSLPIQESFTISSIFNSGLHEFDQNVVFIPLDNAISLFNASEKDIFLEVFLKNPEKAEEIKDQIKNLFINHYVYSWTDLNKSFFGALKVERNVMFIILTLIIIVAAFNIISGLTILVKNKTKEIAILRTLGISKNSIARIFFLTGFTIGFAATITGIIIGVLFSLYIEEVRILITSIFNIRLFPEEIYFLSKMPSEININSILIISLFSLFVTTISTLFPSLSAAKLDPVKALKYE